MEMAKLTSMYLALRASKFIGDFRIIFFTLGLGVFICLGTELVWAKNAQVVFIRGKVQVSPDGGKHWQNIFLGPGQNLATGMCLQLGPKAEVGLLISDGSQIRLHANSIFCLKKIGPNPPATKGKRGFYSLFKGKLWFRNKRKVPKPIFKTPSVVASIRGTEIYIEVDSLKEKLAVLDGEVAVKGQYKQVITKRGDLVTISGQDISVEKLVKPERLAQWLIVVPKLTFANQVKKSPGVSLAQKAMQALANWQIDRAMALAQKSHKLAPTRAEPYLALAYIYQAQGKFLQALQSAKQALNINPQYALARAKAIELYLGLDQIEQAFTLLAETNQNDLALLTVKGFCYLLKQNLSKAERIFSHIVRTYPDSGYGWLGLGLVLWRQGKSKLGLKAMEKASLCYPFWSWPHLYLGKALFEVGEYHQAEFEFKRAIELDPNNPSGYLYLAVLETDLQKPGLAIYHLEKALALNDNRLMFRSRFLLDRDEAFSNINLAFSLAKLGLYSWAKARGDLAVLRYPFNSGAYLFRGVQAVELKNIDPVTLADNRKAELLAPPNSNTYASYQEYQSLLEVPKTKPSIFFKIGSKGSSKILSQIRGGRINLAYKIEVGFAQANGYQSSPDSKNKWINLRLKKSLSLGNELLLEVYGNQGKQDFLSSNPYNAIPTLRQKQSKLNQLIVGGHKRWSVNSGFIWQSGYSFLENKNYFDPNFYHEKQIDRVGFIEGLGFLKFKRQNFLLGLRWEEKQGRFEREFRSDYLLAQNRKFLTKDYRISLRDSFELYPQTFLIGGMTYIYRHIDQGENKYLPELGLVFIREKNIWRAAYSENSEMSMFSGTLLPTEIVGFKQYFGPELGIDRRFLALGWDRFWSDKIFTRTEICQSTNYYWKKPFFDRFDSWSRDQRLELTFNFNMLLNENWGLSVKTGWMNLDAGSKRIRRDLDLDLKLTYVGNNWRIQGGVFVAKQIKTGQWQQVGSNYVFIPGITISRYFWQNKGVAFIRMENLLNKTNTYWPKRQMDFDQRAWPQTYIEAGLKWEW